MLITPKRPPRPDAILLCDRPDFARRVNWQLFEARLCSGEAEWLDPTLDPRRVYATLGFGAMPMMMGGELPVVPGNQPFTTSGTFVVPAFNSLLIRMWGGGGGGGGGGFSAVAGSDGGNTTFNGMTAGGGSGGAGRGPNTNTVSGGSGGTASGGSTNTNGNGGGNGTTGTSGGGGSSPNGGSGGTALGGTTQTAGNAGGIPGGGGGGARMQFSGSTYVSAGGGGGGGYLDRTYAKGAVTVGDSLSVVIGSAGSGGSSLVNGGDGRRGELYAEWS